MFVMNNQNLILLGIGLFVSLIVTIAAVDQYLLSEHDPMEPDGLIWRVRTTFSRIKDLEAVLEVIESGDEDRTVRMLVRLLRGPEPALSVRYLSPDIVRDELFTVDRDLLSHYLPQENLVVIKRWIGLPLADVGVASFNLTQLEKEWKAGMVRLRVVRDISGFGADLFPSPILLKETLSGYPRSEPFSIWLGTQKETPSLPGFAGFEGTLSGGSIQGGYILEVTDARSGELSRMIWIDRESFMVKKIVFFAEGRRTTSIRVQRITLDQGLTAEEILALPHGVEVIRG